MKILVINNGQHQPQNLLHILESFEVEVVSMHEISDMLDPNHYNLVVLTGSSQFPIAYSESIVRPEIEFVKKCRIPVLGICYGCEIVAVAGGGTLTDVGKENSFKGVYTVYPVNETKQDFVPQHSFQVYEAHRWVITDIEDFHVLANSDRGPEIIKHRQFPWYGFQFHPEKCTEETFGDEILKSFLNHLRFTN